jgi:serine/threonine protein kinase
MELAREQPPSTELAREQPPSHLVSSQDAPQLTLTYLTLRRYLHSSRYWEEEKQEWQKCVIHRDLKPDNMLVVSGSNKVKLTDFGEARARKPDKTMTQVGTPIFIAPEVMKGERYDERCDVFSFAVCLLDMMQISPNIVELFAEAYIDFKHSDAGLSLVAITHSVVTEGLRPNIPDTVPTTIKELVTECWELDPEARPYFPEILDRLGYECKAEIYGIPLDEVEATRRASQRSNRIESARLASSRRIEESGGDPNDSNNMFMNKSGDMNSANSTARIDTLVQQVQTKDARLKELEEENKRLKGIVDELESLRAPGATTDSVGV